ncbi:MAG: RNA polymerase sigma factor [Microcoleus sp.]
MNTTNNDEITDSQIITIVLGGDNDAYALIVERYESKLLRYATYILKDYDIASDAVQESFIKAYVNLRSFNLAKQFSPWIYRILHNEAMNIIKRSRKTIALGGADEISDDFVVHFSTAKSLDKYTLNTDVRKCLAQLDVKYREVLVLTYFDNLKYDEISDILHIPTSTVGVRIRRAKAVLKKVCKSNGVKYE